jgi:hypothetical protein
MRPLVIGLPTRYLARTSDPTPRSERPALLRTSSLPTITTHPLVPPGPSVQMQTPPRGDRPLLLLTSRTYFTYLAIELRLSSFCTRGLGEMETAKFREGIFFRAAIAMGIFIGLASRADAGTIVQTVGFNFATHNTTYGIYQQFDYGIYPRWIGVREAGPPIDPRWIGVREAGPPIDVQEARRRSREPSTLGNASLRESGEKAQAGGEGPSKGRD